MLEDRILEDYKKAMKDKDSLKSSALSFLRSEFKNASIDKRLEKLEDADAINVIKKQIKQRQDSIEQFKAGSRQDLADKEGRELEILRAYLPEQLSEEKIKDIVNEVIALTGAKGPQEMGRVMKELLPRLGGKADNKAVSELVKARLLL